MDKEYFSAKFIVDFLEAGDYDFILEYSLIDREGTQWSTKNAKEFKYTASNKRRYWSNKKTAKSKFLFCLQVIKLMAYTREQIENFLMFSTFLVAA